MSLTLDTLDKTVFGIKDTLAALKGLNPDDCDGPELNEIWDMPVKLCRYNQEQVIDRIVIQVRGGYGVTIHTADAGTK